MSCDVTLATTGKTLLKAVVESTVSGVDVCQTGTLHGSVVGGSSLCTVVVGEEPECVTGSDEDGKDDVTNRHIDSEQ